MASASDSEFTVPRDAHRAAGPDSVRCAVITVSDTRTEQTDTSGALIAELLVASGHQVLQRHIVPDGPDHLGPLLDRLRDQTEIQAVLLTGGTGIAPRDLTPEVIAGRLDAELPGFGEIFRVLSWHEIGAAAMLSRATAGRMGNKIVFLMPGSRNAVRQSDRNLAHCR